MAAHILYVTSAEARAGRTHLAAAAARRLHQTGHAVTPLMLAARLGDPVACPEGGAVTRATAVLAEACGLAPEPLFEEGLAALPRLGQRSDWIVVEMRAGEDAAKESRSLRVGQAGADVLIEGVGRVRRPPGVELMPRMDPDLEALPVWTLGTGPRVGIVSLPCMADFSESRLLRGAEWLATPAPGFFDLILLPSTRDPEGDRGWIAEQGLDEWLVTQRLAGCRLLSAGWNWPGSRTLEPAELGDHRAVSLLLGRRLPVPLPDEAMLDRLASWWESSGLDSLLA
jgi:hypothetical protein